MGDMKSTYSSDGLENIIAADGSSGGVFDVCTEVALEQHLLHEPVHPAEVHEVDQCLQCKKRAESMSGKREQGDWKSVRRESRQQKFEALPDSVAILSTRCFERVVR